MTGSHSDSHAGKADGPTARTLLASVALTFFAFLGFGVITVTAKDLANPACQLPRAVYLALGIATVIYVAVALGVFGTLTVDEVVSSGGKALAVAAEPTLGRAGYWMMGVTALFATAGASTSGLVVSPSSPRAITASVPGQARAAGCWSSPSWPRPSCC